MAFLSVKQNLINCEMTNFETENQWVYDSYKQALAIFGLGYGQRDFIRYIIFLQRAMLPW